MSVNLNYWDDFHINCILEIEPGNNSQVSLSLMKINSCKETGNMADHDSVQ